MADKTELLQAIDDAILDADSLEQFINGSDSETVLTRLSAEYPTLQKALKELFENGGIADRFKTLADLQASPLVDGDYALVADDTDGNNGIYIREQGVWNKSKYDFKQVMIDYLEGQARYNPVLIDATTNLDSLVEAGRYLQNGKVGTKDLNYPVENEIVVIDVYERAPSSTVVQVLTTRVGDVYARSSIAGSWLSWRSATESLNEMVGSLSADVRDNRFLFENNFVVSSNIFNGAEPNKTIETDGSIIDDNSRWLSGFIPLKPAEQLTTTPVALRIAYYDKDLNFLSRGGTSSGSLIGAEPIRYIRLSGTHPIDQFQVNKGDTLLPFEPYSIKFKGQGLIKPDDTVFFTKPTNLLKSSGTLPETSVDVDGSIITDSSRWLSDFIPVKMGDVFSVTGTSYRIAYYDDNKNFILRTGSTAGDQPHVTFTVLSFGYIAYMRLSGTGDPETIQLNEGTELLPLDKTEGIKLKQEYLPDVVEVDIEAIKAEVLKDIPVSSYAPSFPTVNFTVIEESWRVVDWLSEDGEVLYGHYGMQLLQSTDDWVTKHQIGDTSTLDAYTIGAVRTLDDGEILFSTLRDESKSQVAKVFKTIGYDRDNPSAATFKEVLAIDSTQANINNYWGMSVYQNIVTVSEYGLRDVDGAKNVYLSTDYGNTFKKVFNLYETQVEGRPPLTMSAHMHTAAYDPYYSRIWVVVGDNPNTATYYSDDLGESWVFVEGSEVVQFTGILALPDVVLFGSDRAPNGVFAYKRNGKDKMPVIEPLLVINDSSILTHVFGLPFKKDWSPTTPTYFLGHVAQGREGYGEVIVATVDGKKAYVIHTDVEGNRISEVFGPTASGKLVASRATPTSNGLELIHAQAPDWVRY